MVNFVEFAHTVAFLDGIASLPVVDRSLRAAGVSRKLIAEASGFLPYGVEAALLESVARALGDRNLGARLGLVFDYSSYGSYADYVLGARDLADAMLRALSAEPLIHPGTSNLLRNTGSHLVFGFDPGLRNMIGREHIDQAAIPIVISAGRHFLGPAWRPDWVEIPGNGNSDIAALEELVGTQVRGGATMPAVAFRVCDLDRANPAPPGLDAIVTHDELPSLMGVVPPQTTKDAVREILRSLLALGDLSEESVARRLMLGRRTLQRLLKEEGTSFREVKEALLFARARALLAETDLPISAVARSLGYSEPNNFGRAFRNWSGFSPSDYRAMRRLAKP